MTSPPDSGRRRDREGAAGFTLIEMLVVLTVLGLVVGIVISRGPMRSQTLELRSVASQVAQTLRLGRAQAISTNGPVRFAVDIAKRSYALDNGRVMTLPPGVGVSVVAVAEETRGKNIAAIRFQPDGSSTGGRVVLAEGTRKIQVGVDWLTGRVTIADAR